MSLIRYHSGGYSEDTGSQLVQHVQQQQRQTTVYHSRPRLKILRHSEYTIGWICALYIEVAAAQAMLDEIHPTLPTNMDDSNTYILGQIGQHNVAIACLPEAQYGTNNAANVATNMRRTFPSIRASLLAGIGGGAPSKVDVRLGDIVVGTRVIQYDLGKIVREDNIERSSLPKHPAPLLLKGVTTLRGKHELQPSQVPHILQRMLPTFKRPNFPDLLFEASYHHELSPSLENCDGCDKSKLKPRLRRPADQVKIHYGTIASSNQVMRNSAARDKITQQLDVLCFEMEAAGLIDTIPCLPIRGICDYSDSHKNKEWQRYAAALAAAYARELLEVLPVVEQTANYQRRHVQEFDTSDYGGYSSQSPSSVWRPTSLVVIDGRYYQYQHHVEQYSNILWEIAPRFPSSQFGAPIERVPMFNQRSNSDERLPHSQQSLGKRKYSQQDDETSFSKRPTLGYGTPSRSDSMQGGIARRTRSRRQKRKDSK